MVNIMSKSGHTTYGLTEYVLDEEKEVNNLSIMDAPGSTAYVIATGNSYILSGGSRTWKKMKLVSTGGSGSSAEAEARIAELEAQVAEQEKTISQKTLELEMTQEQRDNLQVENNKLTDENTELKNNNETLQFQNLEIKSQLNTTKEELATANEKVEKLSDVKVEGDTLVLPDDLIDTVEEG